MNEITFGLVTLRVGDRVRVTDSQKQSARKSEPEGENLAGIQLKHLAQNRCRTNFWRE